MNTFNIVKETLNQIYNTYGILLNTDSFSTPNYVREELIATLKGE